MSNDGYHFLARPLAGFASGICISNAPAMTAMAGFQIRVAQKIYQRLQDSVVCFAICPWLNLAVARKISGFCILMHGDHYNRN
jgi:hypothetical protein